MNIIFADLVHTGHSCNSVPYGISQVAAYAQEKIGDEIAVYLTRKAAEIDRYCAEHTPDMICFSSYVWNEALSLAVAKRIKARFHSCITLFGGPNYPINFEEQYSYLKDHPEVDFFIFREGEEAFLKLFSALKKYRFNVSLLKEAECRVPGSHYFQGDNLIAGDNLPAVSLAAMPSPYLSGLCDRFLKEGLTPILQTTRGCPFKCAYCQEGNEYFDTVRRYGIERTKNELRHIAQIVLSPKLYIADSNFGMYVEDLEVADEIALMQKQYQWPAFVDCISGKNNKSLVLRTAEKIKGGQFSAAIQSSDTTVLNNIKRQNVSINELIEIASEIDLYNTHSFSEIILALPGDTVAAHKKSACDLIDAGIHVVRSHQFIMLPGAELSSLENRQKYGFKTRFRVIPNTSNLYELFGQSFCAPEIDEICVANDSMSFSEYLECRCFDLSLEIFYNNGIFYELHQLLKQCGILISDYILKVNERVQDNARLAKLYEHFLVDSQELWETRGALQDFLDQPGIMPRYSAGEFGRNEQLAYKGVALFEDIKDVLDYSYEIAIEILAQADCLDSDMLHYVYELKKFDEFRKIDPLAIDAIHTGFFHYDFDELIKSGFAVNPLQYKTSGKIKFSFYHTEKYRNYVLGMEDKLCAGLQGYVNFINSNPKVRDYCREISRL